MHVDFSRLSLNPVNKEELAVGRNCEKAGEPYSATYCGWHQMNQAIFDGAVELGYESYLVAFTKNSSELDRHDLFMVNPSSIFADKLRYTLLSNNGFKVVDLRILKKYHH